MVMPLRYRGRQQSRRQQLSRPCYYFQGFGELTVGNARKPVGRYGRRQVGLAAILQAITPSWCNPENAHVRAKLLGRFSNKHMIPFSIERVREGFELSTLRVVPNASNSATTDRMATHIIKNHRPQGSGKTSSSRYVGYGTSRTKRHLRRIA